MALTPLDTTKRYDQPAWSQWSATAVNAGATLTGDAVNVDGYETATVIASCTQTATVLMYVSPDNTNWFTLASGGLHPTSTTITLAANVTQTRINLIGGARFMRIDLTNTSGSNGTATATIALDTAA